ncbi:PREDICTED: scarecrow-like transcription factor PAT1 [Tarenaya hassleriana]|uniref:scarecrow-like transcription factor PAT1 n=1 Tax=Tarenaya hassleriana TaxID=28532 RepID=UPI00053C49CF|nr:PREDICTED: scarecrow-like transcription factor PAT1 [Tarenaya hassleriana]XP_010557769.1 PREDICTED: scarecrow-like transcription factor PAT1 [Tarenaya hassleriana]XP_010557770.1 PREDICTED: scarecrow-like transcription factor PAT1 [Tarenaya hassleriana]XP_010557771.1 PREDICTED: scarecrow-like transcription factor PAT1 [Tarenaya hassleriana]
MVLQSQIPDISDMSTFQPLDNQFNYNSSAKLRYLPVQNPRKRYCTLESSACNLAGTDSPQNNSPDDDDDDDDGKSSSLSGSCVTNDVNDLRHKLKELETAMLGPDPDFIDCLDSTDSTPCQEIYSWRSTYQAIARRDLRTVLVFCAKAVSDNDLLMAQWLIDELRQMVSVSGEPIQRLGAYLLEGLVARLSSSGSSIYKSLNCCPEPASTDLLSYMHILYEVCPYFKFGYMSANGAIAEAMKEENRVHIVDFQIGQGSQWVTLIQAFAARPGGPPRIRITGIDDVMSAYARGGGLSIVGNKFAKLADQFKVPFEFNAVPVSGSEVKPENLGIRPGEALAVNFAFVLHHMPDESVSTENHRDRLLRMVKSLSPKVVTLVEQESNTNTAAFLPRFFETMNYYTAMFESIDVSLPRGHKQRINVEQHCLARDVVNIVACEGTERVERHELLGKWKSRFEMAGFAPYPLSSLVNSTIEGLLKNYSDKYRLEEREGALFLGWGNRDLVASCAWK